MNDKQNESAALTSNRQLFVAWSDDGQYVAALFGTSETPEQMQEKIDRESEQERRTINRLRPVKITVHLASQSETSSDPYKAVCQGGSGGKCTQPDCEICWPEEPSDTPQAVLKWAVDSFGPIALNRDERAARMTEEAIEVAQVEGVPLEIIQRIAARVYSRPVGELGQEIGGLVLGLYALAANAGVDVDGEFNREFARVLSKPKEWWARKHAEKVAAGTADLTPVKATDKTGGDPECFGSAGAPRSDAEFRARVGLPAPKASAVRDSIAPNIHCPVCDKWFWADKFDEHKCSPLKVTACPTCTRTGGIRPCADSWHK